MQTGPVTALFVCLLRSATGWTGSVAAPAVLVLCLINAGCLVDRAATLAHQRRHCQGGGAASSSDFSRVAFSAFSTTDAHPTHAVIALLWFLAVRAARRGRPEVVGLLIGVACGLDTWGVLGAGAVLALPSVRAVARSIVAALVAGAFWLPFLVAGGTHSSP